jgi:hypothetical protein
LEAAFASACVVTSLQVVNPLQNVAPVIFDKWRMEFANAGFHNPILVATHADVLQLMGASSDTVCCSWQLMLRATGNLFTAQF